MVRRLMLGVVLVASAIIAAIGCSGGGDNGTQFPSPSPTATGTATPPFSSNQAWITPDHAEYWLKTQTGFSGTVTSVGAANTAAGVTYSLPLNPAVAVAKSQHHVFLVASTANIPTGVPYLNVLNYTEGTATLTYSTTLTPTTSTTFPFSGDNLVSITATHKDLGNGKLKLTLNATQAVTITEARFYDTTNGYVVLVCPEAPALALTVGTNTPDVCPTLLPQAGHAYEAVFRGTAPAGSSQPEYFQFIPSFVYTSSLGIAP